MALLHESLETAYGELAPRLELASDRTEEDDARSVNEWVDQLRGMAGQAHGQARHDSTGESEYSTWLDMAAACLRRAAQVRRKLDE